MRSSKSRWSSAISLVLFACLALDARAQSQTPVPGHYPPGQSGIRGGSSPPAGWAYTNFSRFFSNLDAKASDGSTTRELDEVRFANISMFTWISDYQLFGLTYGALAGVPFATGNLNASSSDLESAAFGLGDILITPLALYGRGPVHDFQLQLTLWSASGEYTPGSTGNRGSGFQSLVYSLGGAWYPGADRRNWSASAIARYGQNFEQEGTGVTPGDDLVIDWGVGKVLRRNTRSLDVGVSGFGSWQVSEQSGGTQDVDPAHYRYFGVGPEGSYSPWEHWTLRLRLHWEFGTRNAVQGNNVWFIVHYAS